MLISMRILAKDCDWVQLSGFSDYVNGKYSPLHVPIDLYRPNYREIGPFFLTRYIKGWANKL